MFNLCRIQGNLLRPHLHTQQQQQCGDNKGLLRLTACSLSLLSCLFSLPDCRFLICRLTRRMRNLIKCYAYTHMHTHISKLAGFRLLTRHSKVLCHLLKPTRSHNSDGLNDENFKLLQGHKAQLSCLKLKARSVCVCFYLCVCVWHAHKPGT